MNALKKGTPKSKKKSAPHNPDGRPEQFKPEQVIRAIQGAQGLLAGAARLLECSRTTVYAYVKKYPEVQAALEEQNETTKDFVEGKLIDQIRNDNITAIIFYLKTKAKDRGYIERTEHSGPDGAPLVPARPDLSGLDDKQLSHLEKARQIIESAGTH